MMIVLLFCFCFVGGGEDVLFLFFCFFLSFVVLFIFFVAQPESKRKPRGEPMRPEMRCARARLRGTVDDVGR